MINQVIPITIISGFLGAGKTSLLSYILTAEHGKKMAVLVNDFGIVNIDAELIVSIEGETISLTNGCICCTIRNDLMEEVLKLLAKDDKPEHIIIETSGISDPSLVAHTFQLTALHKLVEVQSIISVVDADQVLNLDEEFVDLAKRQINIADLIIVNKTDLVSEALKKKVHQYVQNIAHNARIIDAVNAVIPLELIFGTSRFNASRLAETELNKESSFHSWVYINSEPFTFMAIRKALENLPTDIYRVKGFIRLEGFPEDKGIFQMTGHRSWLRLGVPWNNEKAITRLVFIGKKSKHLQVEINHHFNKCQNNYCREALDNKKTPIMVKDIRAMTIMF